jgi:probable rRNA maturation factor
MFNIIISSDSRYSINKLVIRQAVLNVLTRQKVSGKVEVEVNVVGDRKMHELNKKYRDADETTDVLSFAFEDPSVGFIAAPDKILRLGSIVISYPQAVEDAAAEGIPVEEEIQFLVEHGTNHLLGIHHH